MVFKNQHFCWIKFGFTGATYFYVFIATDKPYDTRRPYRLSFSVFSTVWIESSSVSYGVVKMHVRTLVVVCWMIPTVARLNGSFNFYHLAG